MGSDSKAIAKLKKNSRKLPTELGFSGFKNRLLLNLPASFIFWLLKNFLVNSDYKLKRESTKFFEYSNVAYGASQARRCDRLLVTALRLISRDFDDDYVVLIRSAVRSTLNNAGKRPELSENISEATKRLEISKCDATGWYQLSRGLFSLGYFRAAQVARENSLDLSILEGNSVDVSGTVLSRRLEAHLERREFAEVGWVLTGSHNQLSTKHLKHFGYFSSLFERGHAHLSDVGVSRNRKNGDLFRDLITGRTVAIVGPGTPHNDYGAEIDSFDIVIRIKFIGNELLNVPNYHGTRTDISFIGAISAVKIQEALLINNLKSFKLILSNQTPEDSIALVPIHEIEVDDVIYRTPTTSGIRTLKEVIKYSPSKVKVFGFDFYSTLTPYSKEMTEFYENSSWKFGHPNDFAKAGVYFKFARARDFSYHDPVSNFCFAQNLYKAGLFDIEPYGKSILELTPYQYVERLEEMLGDW